MYRNKSEVESTINSKKKAEMEEIKHRTVSVNGINMHIAEKGEGPIVLFLHGFPELWYSWRHQILAFSALGYRAVAPDLRGYGDTDAPPSPTSYTSLHLVGDIVALINSLGADKVYLVGHDWGAMVGWYLCLLRPDLVHAYVSLTIPYIPRHPQFNTVDALRSQYGHNYYICGFQEPGMAEAEIANLGTEAVMKNVLSIRETGPLKFPDLLGPGPESREEATWLSPEDLAYYVDKFERTGFTGGLNYYRCLNLNWELMAPWTGVQVKVPAKFIVGDLDMTYTTPAFNQYVHDGSFKRDVPLLDDDIVVMEGVAHFINQEKPEEVNNLIHDFITNF